MRDTTERFHKGDPYSRIAGEKTKFKKEKDLGRIKEWMIKRGKRGASSYECRKALDLSHQTCSARFTDLKTKQHGPFLIPLLDDQGDQVSRLTDSGSPAGVWIADV